jgi:hypothetical protein
MVYFQTKNPNLGKFWRVLQWKMLVYFMNILSLVRSFDTFNGYLVFLWQVGMFFSVLVYCINKNLATMVGSTFEEMTI